MRLVATNIVFRSESIMLHPAMVVLTDSYISDYAAIDGDMPLVEWIGGVVFLTAKEDLEDLPEQVTVGQLKSLLLSDDMPRFAYHLVGVDVNSQESFSPNLLVRLEEDFI